MRKRLAPDSSIDPITAWHRWFLSAQTERLAALDLPPDQHERELTGVTTLTAAIADRMRSDYLARTPRP